MEINQGLNTKERLQQRGAINVQKNLPTSSRVYGNSLRNICLSYQ